MRVLAGAAAMIALGGVAHADTFRKGPYLQNVSRHSVTLMFESSTSGECVVRLAGRAVHRSEVRSGDVAEIVVGDLDAGRRYAYEVDCAGERVTGEFATAPKLESPFSFVVFGDSRSSPPAHRRVVERIRAEVPDFILGTGDMVNEGSSEQDWQEFFDIEGQLLKDNPFYPSLGNHDRQGRGRTADSYRRYFALPENSPSPERYYSFRYGSARFIVLDSNAYSFALSDQTAWLEEQLQAARLDPSIEHVFVTMHHPPFSVSLHGGQVELREAWTPLFERYRVDAVFSGHDHVYSRAERAGVRYFVSGGGGAPLYPRKRASPIDEEATAYFERVNHYIRVHVVDGFVEVTAVRADGTTIETVSWGQRRQAQAVADLVRSVGSAAEGPAPAPAPQATIAPQQASTLPRRVGWLGTLGAVLVVLSAGAVWLALRS